MEEEGEEEGGIDFESAFATLEAMFSEFRLNGTSTFSDRPPRHPWLLPNATRAALLCELSLLRPLTGSETIELMYHDGSAALLSLGGGQVPVSVKWRALRKLVKVRPIALFWQQLAVESACAPGGHTRAEDVHAWAQMSLCCGAQAARAGL
jgi:hypothetical protein